MGSLDAEPQKPLLHSLLEIVPEVARRRPKAGGVG